MSEPEIKFEEKEPEVVLIERICARLRKLLWLHHGHGVYLYGDDGEMQCSSCMIDFKRDPINKIEQEFERQAIEVAAKYFHKIV